MDSTMTYSDFLSMEASRQKRTIFSSETMQTEANSHLKQFVSSSLTKSNTQKTSSFSEETMNAQALTEFMVFMTNAREDTTLNFGRLSQTVSTVFPSPLLLMRKSYVCMEDSHPSFQIWNKLEELCDQQMYPTQASFVICSGLTLKKTFKDGRKTIEESLSFSHLTLSVSS